MGWQEEGEKEEGNRRKRGTGGRGEQEEGEQEETDDEEEGNLSYNYKEIIQKVRRIVHLFRKSPVKNDLLQNSCQKKYGKKLVLLRDTKTRWNSLLKMGQRCLINLNQIDHFPGEKVNFKQWRLLWKLWR